MRSWGTLLKFVGAGVLKHTVKGKKTRNFYLKSNLDTKLSFRGK